MPSTDQIETARWLLNQAKDYLLIVRNPPIKEVRYVTMYGIQLSAEFSFKAALALYNNITYKTRNPYTLILFVPSFLPEIKDIFPRHSEFEKRLFHYLKPAIVFTNDMDKSLPTLDELGELVKRVEMLYEAVESYFMKITTNEKA